MPVKTNREPSPLLKEKLVKHSKAEQLHQIIKWSESEVGPASKNEARVSV